MRGPSANVYCCWTKLPYILQMDLVPNDCLPENYYSCQCGKHKGLEQQRFAFVASSNLQWCKLFGISQYSK